MAALSLCYNTVSIVTASHKKTMKHLQVAAAVITHQDRILCVQRGLGRQRTAVSFKYEFPGGKLEKDESGHTALMRELKEELQIMTVIRPDDYMMTVEHTYPECHITMHVYRCTIQSPDITLTEHIACRWLPAEQLDTLDWAPADILIVRKLMEQDC